MSKTSRFVCSVLVTYLLVGSALASARDGCATLTTLHTGKGTDPVATALADGSAWTKRSVEPNVGDGFFVTADVDGDGHLDLVGEASNVAYVWFNEAGDGTEWRSERIGNVFLVKGMDLGDIDGDGSPDVAVNDGRVSWWRDEAGDGSDWTGVTVESIYLGDRPLIRVADIDNDGDGDLVGAVQSDEMVVWWENRSGDGTFWEKEIVSDVFVGAESVHVADLDGDGDPDILGAAGTSGVVWWENTKGNGSAWSEHAIDPLFVGAQTAAAADIDLDGDLDAFAIGEVPLSGITWWENSLGDGSLWIEHVVDREYSELGSVDAADIDSDGDVDLVGVTLSGVSLAWWENLDRVGQSWEVRVVEEDLVIFSDTARAADLDGDGDPDLAASGQLSWWENRTENDCAEGEYPVGDRVELLATAEEGWGVGSWSGTEDDDRLGPINYVVIGIEDQSVTANYSEGCFELTRNHVGSGSDPFAEPDASPGCPTGSYVAGQPIALTGLPELGAKVEAWVGTDDDGSDGGLNSLTMPAAPHSVSVEYAPNLSCYPLESFHTGLGRAPVPSPAHSVSCEWGNFLAGEVITLVADPGPDSRVARWQGTDDDVSTDLTNALSMPALNHEVAAHYARLCHPLTLTHTGRGSDPVAAAIGAGKYWDEFELSSAEFRKSVDPADIDGDGDVDVLHGGSSSIYWAENLFGDGESWSDQLVTDSFSSTQSVLAVDLDGDGDLDILGAAFHYPTYFGDGIQWWENTIGDGSAWTNHVIDRGFAAAIGAVAADFDGDGDLDVAAVSGRAFEKTYGSVTWWENRDSIGTLWEEHFVGVYPGGESVLVRDMDQDGDPDLLTTSLELTQDVSWWENVDAGGSDWTYHGVDYGNYWRSADAADFDGDGDLDIVAEASGIPPRIEWFENVSGDGGVWEPHRVADRGAGDLVRAEDIDRDGDMDFLTSGSLGIGISIWENASGDGSTWRERSLDREFTALALITADVDRDGDPDVVGSNSGLVSWWSNSLLSEAECDEASYHAGDRIGLTATPALGFGVSGWTGTRNDERFGESNGVTMPADSHTASAHYLAGCFELSLDHSGEGRDPVAAPSASPGCKPGSFVVGEAIALTAMPAPGWKPGSWFGTSDDESEDLSNALLMPAKDHFVAVGYVPEEGRP